MLMERGELRPIRSGRCREARYFLKANDDVVGARFLRSALTPDGHKRPTWHSKRLSPRLFQSVQAIVALSEVARCAPHRVGERLHVLCGVEDVRRDAHARPARDACAMYEKYSLGLQDRGREQSVLFR